MTTATTSTMTGTAAVVVGGSRGLGLGVARAAHDAGAKVTVVARDLPTLAGLGGMRGNAGEDARAGFGGMRGNAGEDALAGLDGMAGDATEEEFAAKVLATTRPGLVVITAGAAPWMGPLTEQTWATFSANWHADVRIVFTWLRAALTAPLAPGSRVVVFGSAAELRGSPLSGGYAGAKATVRLITGYAAAEAGDLGITMTTVLPVITPGTTVGETAIEAYAASAGRTPEQFRANLPAAPSPASAGASIVGLAAVPDAALAPAYRLDAGGLTAL